MSEKAYQDSIAELDTFFHQLFSVDIDKQIRNFLSILC